MPKPGAITFTESPLDTIARDVISIGDAESRRQRQKGNTMRSIFHTDWNDPFGVSVVERVIIDGKAIDLPYESYAGPAPEEADRYAADVPEGP